MSAAEDTSLRTKLLSAGQSDPLTQIIRQVTLGTRESIRSCGSNRLSEDETLLPEAAILHAVAIIRHRLLTRFGTGESNEDRMAEYKAAERYMADVAKCILRVEDPFGGESAPAAVPKMAVNPSPRRFRWADQNGI